MALEAGEVMHQVYAGVRIWQLENKQKLPKHALATANRIFGAQRWLKILETVGKKNADEREHIIAFCFAILHTAKWEDNPDDRIRTIANMEMSAIHYVDERLYGMEDWPLYVRDLKDPKCMIGIEQVFDVVMEFSDGKLIRYIGTVDGLVQKAATEEWVLDENKTASRLDDGWRMSFDMSHQITAYCAASTTVFGFPVFKARVTGCKVKPANKGEDVYVLEVARDEYAIRNWAAWVHYSASMYEQYKDDFELAPRFTHSCNRFFRPCSLLAFCCDTPQGRIEQFEQMVPADQSPSEKSIAEGV